MASTTSYVFVKEIYKKYGVFDTSFDVSADFEIMLRFIEKYQLKVSYINDYLVRMRMGVIVQVQ